MAKRAARKASQTRATKKKVDARKARVRDLAPGSGDVKGGASGLSGGGFQGFSGKTTS